MRAVCGAAVVVALMLVLAGCGPNLPPSKPLSELTPTEYAGHLVFQAKCARCHYPNTTRGFHGPGLQGLYKIKYLPSGAPANDDRISGTIINGHGTMQGFGNELTDQQVAQLLAYLHTL